MKIFIQLFLLSALLFLAGCKPKTGALIAPDEMQADGESDNGMEDAEEVTLAEIEVSAPAKTPYHASESRINDLLHTKLKVSFDMPNRHLNGEAWLDLQPHFYATKTVDLDMKGFDIHEVALLKNGAKSKLEYDYDGFIATIMLDKKYVGGEDYSLYIKYTAKPYELEVLGSAAITEARGLYFINHDGSTDQPQQIWTQGETEASSCWFPTIDSPNEKTTQEIYITVEDRFKTISNGELLTSTPNSDGTRTDYWKQDKPHAPYLFAMAIGEFVETKDTWNGMEVNYYMEKDYGDYGQLIFGATPEMLTFYSELLDYPYPWDKYHQIVVRDFVSGAMENTGCVLFYDGLNLDDRTYLDETHEDIVAHELFHHWFGDLVTCESWANLPLNESFATYGEYLWMEHKYGRPAAELHRLKDMWQYLSEANNGKKVDMIRYDYKNKEDMFDSHSYAKGGCILHMLRNIVGDDAFFQSLGLYLKQNEYNTVEIHNLRLAFEEVTGEDLNWFFNQWFLNSGHPILEFDYDYDAALGRQNITIKQVQSEDPFVLPMAIEIELEGRSERYEITLEDRQQTFSFDVTSEPVLVHADADKYLLAEVTHNRPESTFLHQFNNPRNYVSQREGLMGFKEKQNEEEYAQAMLKALSDPQWMIRSRSLSNVDLSKIALKDQFIAKFKDLAANDEKSIVRASAISLLAGLEDRAYKPDFEKALDDRAFSVVGAAIGGLGAIDEKAAMNAARKWKESDAGDIVNAVASVYASEGGQEGSDYFEDKISKVSGGAKYDLLENYGSYLMNAKDDKHISKGIASLGDVGLNESTWWVRLSAVRALADARGAWSGMADMVDDSMQSAALKGHVSTVNDLIDKIKEKEKNPQLQMFYSRF